jgi:hypothetical protein
MTVIGLEMTVIGLETTVIRRTMTYAGSEVIQSALDPA